MNNNNVNIEFTPEAMQVLSNIRNRIAWIGNHLGRSSSEYVEAASSFAFAIQGFLSCRPKKVQADGELSLFGDNGIMVFGLNATRGNISNADVAQYLKENGQEHWIVVWSVNS